MLRPSAVWVQIAVITFWSLQTYRRHMRGSKRGGKRAMHERWPHSRSCPHGVSATATDAIEYQSSRKRAKSGRRDEAKKGLAPVCQPRANTATPLSGRMPGGQQRTSRRCSPPIRIVTSADTRHCLALPCATAQKVRSCTSSKSKHPMAGEDASSNTEGWGLGGGSCSPAESP